MIRHMWRLSEGGDDHNLGLACASWGTDVVTESQIQHRALSLAVPKGSMTAVQREIIDAVRTRAKMSNANPPVDIVITEF
jgi:hypothetical protein